MFVLKRVPPYYGCQGLILNCSLEAMSGMTGWMHKAAPPPHVLTDDVLEGEARALCGMAMSCLPPTVTR